MVGRDDIAVTSRLAPHKASRCCGEKSQEKLLAVRTCDDWSVRAVPGTAAYSNCMRNRFVFTRRDEKQEPFCCFVVIVVFSWKIRTKTKRKKKPTLAWAFSSVAVKRCCLLFLLLGQDRIVLICIFMTLVSHSLLSDWLSPHPPPRRTYYSYSYYL